MDQMLLYMLAGGALYAVGLAGLFVRRELVIRIVAGNVMASGVFIVLVAGVPKGPDGRADPVMQALVLTGIVISISVSGYGLALIRRLGEERRHEREQDATEQPGRES